MPLLRSDPAQRASQTFSFGVSAVVHGVVVASIVLAFSAPGGGEGPAGPSSFEATFTAESVPTVDEPTAPPLELAAAPDIEVDLELPAMGHTLAPSSPEGSMRARRGGAGRALADPGPRPPRTSRSFAPQPKGDPAPVKTRRVARTPLLRKPVAAPPAPEPTPAAYTPPRPRQGQCPAPRYPRVAERRGLMGTVLLDIDVAPDGSVADVRVETSSGHRVLDERAVETVRGWRFHPARRGERPCAGTVRKPIEFKLPGR